MNEMNASIKRSISANGIFKLISNSTETPYDTRDVKNESKLCVRACVRPMHANWVFEKENPVVSGEPSSLALGWLVGCTLCLRVLVLWMDARTLHALNDS